ncbi:Glycosyl transferases group 1 [Pirellula sp. SH-Sr6A]|uniref:glycosyltransferase n=1 Tax=Pirellula sp. SH-Sr6A TaxID=1632865 RepID=UPI00078E8B8E|nr:glycosyltransferase [Pirellula sp. SH-Sr6A]AMV31840.1 Glycosyl transferases group 1 [Pirellula sp. SH-Sr6A]
MNRKRASILVDASNSGGGSNILAQYLNDKLVEFGHSCFFVVPKQFTKELNRSYQINSFGPFDPRRQAAIEKLATQYKPDSILSFGNIPLRKRFPNCRHLTFFHNAYLLPGLAPKAIPLRVRLRILAIQLSIKFLKVNTDTWIVQTNFVKGRLAKWLRLEDGKVVVAPFFRPPQFSIDAQNINHKLDLFYPSNFSYHKNHCNLIRAISWCQDHNQRFTLGLTLGEVADPSFQSALNSAISNGADIRLLGTISHDQVFSVMRESKAVVFPSVLETLGLGLVEAATLKKPVVASNTNWIDEIVSTDYKFDPSSPESIGRTIIRCLSEEEQKPAIRRIEDKIDVVCDLLSGYAC